VSVPAFYQWKRVLAAGDTPVSASGPPTFMPLRVAPANAPAVELVLPPCRPSCGRSEPDALDLV